jgi:hypothetical protein
MTDRQKRGINEARAEEAVQNEVAFPPYVAYVVEWHEQQHGDGMASLHLQGMRSRSTEYP